MKKIILTGVVFLFVLISLISVSAEIIWDESEGGFTLIVDYPVCDDSGEFFTDYSQSNNPIFPTIGESAYANCYNSDAEEGVMCCPIGTECRITNKKYEDPEGDMITTWNCFATDVNFCWDYKDESDCNNDTAGVRERSVEKLFSIEEGQEIGGWFNESGSPCVDVARNFRCEWNETADTKKCQPRYNNESICKGDEVFHNDPDKCIVENIVVTGNCDTDEVLEVSWDAHWEIAGAGEGCKWGSKSIDCEDITKLSFFTWINLISVIVFIMIYYFYVSKKKI